MARYEAPERLPERDFDDLIGLPCICYRKSRAPIVEKWRG